MSARERALSLLAQANNHGDLAVKLSSLKQAKEILSSVDPSISAQLFPYLSDLQFSPESLVRKTLIEAVEEIGLKAMDHLSMLMPVILVLLNDNDCVVATQSIVTGTNIFCAVFEELCLQFNRRGIVDKWLVELWTWAVRWKDAVLNILWEAAPLGTKLLALKFLETYVLIFTSNTNGSDQTAIEGRRARMVNISWVVVGHPILDPVTLTSEANGLIGILFDLLRSASSLPGQLTISVVNCLAAIARKRSIHYNSILSALLDFDPTVEMVKGHMPSIQYSLRTAYLSFLRCTHPVILESRDRLFRVLRGMNAGDAVDQAVRQADKMMKNNERASREARYTKDDQSPDQVPVGGEAVRKRSLPLESEESVNGYEVAYKRVHRGPSNPSDHPGPINDIGHENSVNGLLSKVFLPGKDLTPAEQMIAMIGALIAEGERGVDSLEVLINEIHPDLLADIVITNMRNLPNNPPPLARATATSAAPQSGSSVPPQISISAVSAPSFSSGPASTSLPEVPTPVSLSADSKRDPRRDPRRLDPRRPVVPVELPSLPIVEENNSTKSELVVPFPVSVSAESAKAPTMPKKELVVPNSESPISSDPVQPPFKEEVPHEETKEITPAPEINSSLDSTPPDNEVEGLVTSMPLDIVSKDEVEVDPLALFESESSNVTVPEEVYPDFPVVTSVVELTEEQQINVKKLIVERIIESSKHIKVAECSQTRMALLARLVDQVDANDDALVMIQQHVVSDYQLLKGHELVMHVLYHLHTIVISDSVEQSSFAAIVYEKFLLGMANSLLDALPASDKSLSRLFGEAPVLTASALNLLDNLCSSNYKSEKGVRDGGDRVTQGLGAVWSLILGRPVNRQACLDIALKCAVHLEDEIRAKAIRLVANKLYPLDYISVDIEQFATRMLSTAVDQHVSDKELVESVPTEQRTEGEASERGSQETSVSGSQFSKPGTSEKDSTKGAQLELQDDSLLSFAEAQRLISLYFALCTKRPTLLQFVFESYGQAPKSVKQAIHRHIPILIRTLGSSYFELLRIVSDPPLGSENLLSQVLNILCEETTPSSDLIATVKHLYETKIKDATILIPILSSLTKAEVLPIFPRLVELPLDKFQTALAHILQGSAHTGPALTPAEVLVAIHGITPEKDGLTLKKITDVCTACFEQRTVFTQQVLAKALNQMVDQTPLPLLFMRTVIQAIDAFPSLVDFVMEILLKLVTRQIWRMPKLWVGFLKCVAQTQPHSFRVLLQLPPQQLESALNKYASLRSPLTAYASQSSLRASLPRPTLVLLGLVNESPVQQIHTSSLHASDAASSIHGATIS